MAYRHVLVICDGSAEADTAVRAASQIALRDHARLTVAAVIELEGPSLKCDIGTSIWNDVLRDAAVADLERARRVVDSPAHFTVLGGKFGPAVAGAVRELDCDAVMVAARPRQPLRRLLSRDRAKAVRRRTRCPVLQPR